MSSYTQILYHIVFSTKERIPCLIEQNRERLYNYIWGIIKNKKSLLYRINGVDEHIHILSSLHPTICLSDFVKEIKACSTLWIKENNIFSDFTCWQIGYGAFTCSIKEKEVIINYIKNQKEHHKNISYQDEMKNLLSESKINFDERYLD